MQALRSSSQFRFADVRQVSTLVIGHASGKSVTQALLSSVKAASALGEGIDVLLAGSGESVSEAGAAVSKVSGVTNVILANHSSLQHQLAEPMANLIKDVIHRHGYRACVMPANTTGKNILPRAAALLGSQPISDVVAIESKKRFRRTIYAGNALETVERECGDEIPLMMTVRPTSFEPVSDEQPTATVRALSEDEVVALEMDGRSAWVSATERQQERPDLATARVVVSGGRALKSAEHFKIIDELADELRGAVGASRAAVDAGMVPNDMQVGQTGKVVAPDLYIAVGISGAIQHVAGIKDSKVIVAINSDSEAPIFQIADLGLVGDLFSVIPELTKAIRQQKAAS